MATKEYCDFCGAKIIWRRTASGSMMPCDPRPYYFRIGGRERIYCENDGKIYACQTLKSSLGSDGIGYIPHFATCARGVIKIEEKREEKRVENIGEQMSFLG